MRALVAVLALAALAAGVVVTRQLPRPVQVQVDPAASATTEPAGVAVQVTGMVFQDELVAGAEPSGSQLCVGQITQLGVPEAPLECSASIPLVGWDWDVVDDETSRGGRVTGSYHLVGRYDGRRLALTAPPRPPSPGTTEPEPDTTPPCPEPPGGWLSGDPPTPPAAGIDAAVRRVTEDLPDHAATWVHHPQLPPPGEVGPYVLVVAFTGDVAAHEAQVLEVWDGPLCVTRFEHSSRELARVMRELPQVTADLGVQLVSRNEVVQRNVVEVEATWLDDADRHALEERYGSAIELTTSLRPVDEEDTP